MMEPYNDWGVLIAHALSVNAKIELMVGSDVLVSVSGHSRRLCPVRARLAYASVADLLIDPVICSEGPMA